MKNIYKIGIGAAALTLIAGGNAMAGKGQWVMKGQAPKDTVKVAKDTVANVPESAVVDEVIWVVGDEPILKSDVETMRLQGQMEGMQWKGDPDCAIPEQMAVQKLFLHQAEIDSIVVSESEVTTSIDQQINYWISMAGSKEKLEEYRNQTVAQMRQQMRDEFKNQQRIEKMRKELVKDVATTPSEVRKYFDKLPVDSLPFVPVEVEVQIITRQPKATREEVNKVKEELRNFTDRVTRGETSFATLARLYSEDPVESEFGFHIIQLIDKRGDRIKVRHILRKPKVDQEVVEKTRLRLDSIADEIREGKYSFEEAASYISDDKDTRNNNGLMATSQTEEGRTSRFQMKALPTEVAQQVENMKVGDVSKAFEMINAKGQKVCAIIKLKSRIPGHRATLAEDYQLLKNIVLNKMREEKLHNWVVDKIKHTYVWMADRYKNCDFEYQGWVK